MEDNPKNSKWKTTKKFKMEDDQKNSKWKTTKINQNGRRQKKMHNGVLDPLDLLPGCYFALLCSGFRPHLANCNFKIKLSINLGTRQNQNFI